MEQIDEFDDISNAAYRVAHESEMSCRDIAAALHMSYQVLINKVNPLQESNQLSLVEAVALQQVTGRNDIHEATGRALGAQSINPTSKPADSIMSGILHVYSECGDVSRVLNEALADGKLTTREKGDIQTEINEAVDALVALRMAIKDYKD